MSDELKPLNEDMDAARWAREFKALLARPQEIDEGTLIAWFANAIMCGHDTAHRTAPAVERERVIEECRAAIEAIPETELAIFARGNWNAVMLTKHIAELAVQALSHPAPDTVRVPVEPTEAMIEAGGKTPKMKIINEYVSSAQLRGNFVEERLAGPLSDCAIAQCYKAMLSAAQSAKQRGGG